MNADLKEYISACSICHSHETSQQRDTLMPHDVPDRPWAKVGTDLFSISDTSYLIVVDYYINFWEVNKLDNTDSVTVIKKMKTHFARYGISDQVVSDNGPQYTSHHFANFSRTWDFEHITNSPGHSQSNGMAESAVKTAKRIIKRAKESKSDVYLAILEAKHAKQPGSKPDEQTYQDTPVHNRQPACTETDLRPARCPSKQQTATSLVSRSPRQRSPTSARRRCRADEAVSEARETRVEAGRRQ